MWRAVWRWCRGLLVIGVLGLSVSDLIWPSASVLWWWTRRCTVSIYCILLECCAPAVLVLFLEASVRLKTEQVAQLLQRDRAAGWVTFGQNISGRLYFAPNAVGARKLKTLIFYTINPLLYEKWSLCVFEPLWGSLGATYAVHRRLIGKLLVDFLLVIIQLFH